MPLMLMTICHTFQRCSQSLSALLIRVPLSLENIVHFSFKENIVHFSFKENILYFSFKENIVHFYFNI
jgi:hypothetical protein